MGKNVDFIWDFRPKTTIGLCCLCGLWLDQFFMNIWLLPEFQVNKCLRRHKSSSWLRSQSHKYSAAH